MQYSNNSRRASRQGGNNEGRSFGRSTDRKPSHSTRPRRDDSDGDRPRKSFGHKSFKTDEQGQKHFSRHSFEKKSGAPTRRFGDKTEGDRKPRFGNDSDRKPRFGSRTDNDQKPRFGSKPDNDRKPRFGAKSEGGRKPFNTKNFENKLTDIQDKPTRTKNAAVTMSDPEGIRLNRYIANAGVCSRRDAEKYITAGVISINGKIVTELATKVYYGDIVKFNDAPLMPEKKTYILLNKPKDYVTTLDDPHADKTVMDLIGNAGHGRVFPVGRLDKSTTGLLLLTNDGELAEQLSHPRYNKQKIYQVTLDHAVSESDMEKLLNGITLEDGPAQADDLEYCTPGDKTEVGILIHSGRNRIVRRMFEALGYKVKKLDRVYYAGLTKKNLPRGKWRFLEEKEIVMLKRGTYK